MRGGPGYLLIGALLANIVWFIYMSSVSWGAPASLPLFDKMVAIAVVQPIAIMSAGLRLVLWGPSLAAWYVDPNGYPFGMWLAPGFYVEAGNV